jgi:hypothetical protein
MARLHQVSVHHQGVFGMTTQSVSAGGRWPRRTRVLRILLLYTCGLAICPHVLLTLAVGALQRLSSHTGEFGSVSSWLLTLLVLPPAALYLMPVAAVFGESHLGAPSEHGLLVFGDLTGHLQVMIFYTAIAMVAAGVHILFLRRGRVAGPDVAPNQPPPS